MFSQIKLRLLSVFNQRTRTSSSEGIWPDLTRLLTSMSYLLSRTLTRCSFLPLLPAPEWRGWGTGVQVPGRNVELFRIFVNHVCHSGCWRDWCGCWVKVQSDRILHIVTERVIALGRGLVLSFRWRLAHLVTVKSRYFVSSVSQQVDCKEKRQQQMGWLHAV